MGFFVYDRSYPSKEQWESALTDFAELLSLDRYSLTEIAQHMKVTVGTACVLLRVLCERMGEA